VHFRFGPHERLSVFVVGFDEGIDVLLDLLDRGERRARQRLALQNRKPTLDLVESRGPRWRIMERDTRMALQPIFILLVRVQIVEDDFKLAVGIGGNDLIHEVEEPLAAAAFLGRSLDLASGHLKSREQCLWQRRRLPLVPALDPGLLPRQPCGPWAGKVVNFYSAPRACCFNSQKSSNTQFDNQTVYRPVLGRRAEFPSLDFVRLSAHRLP